MSLLSVGALAAFLIKSGSSMSLQSEGLVEIFLSDFEAKSLASGVILATYRAVKHESDGRRSYSLRSSIWKLIDGRWQMIFHQGTPTRDGT